MGEVYRARDPRLQREVALKVLPDVATVGAERRERFTREALAVAALNHPHIVTIHSVEDAGTTLFLTMELVEGRSLADALPRPGCRLEGVLTIGIAVADAISAAHQKGITHRDLKPANIMLGEGEHAGRIKVLDFGLAKVVEAQLGTRGVSMLPTEAPARSGPITAEGHILGTVAYMSPEQAEGRTIDGRSDLFSLGVVLYEMATGQRPFTGVDQLVGSLVHPQGHAEVDHRHQPGTSHATSDAPSAALVAKDPERRYQTAKDLRNDLEDLKASLVSGESATATGNCRGSPHRPRPFHLSHRSRRFRPQTRKSSWRWSDATPARSPWPLRCCSSARQPLSTGCCGPTRELASSQQSFADLQVTQLTTTGNAERPVISSDGRYVAYVQRDGDD